MAMKKLVLVLTIILLSINVFGQIKPIEFLGIPVGGSVNYVRSQLENKGFVYIDEYDTFHGKFDGQDVGVKIMSNKGRVWRIVVLYETSSNKSMIQARYNHVYNSFVNNGKYFYVNGNPINNVTDITPYNVNQQRFKFTAYPYSPYYGCAWVQLTYYEGDYGVVLYYENPQNMPDGRDF